MEPMLTTREIAELRGCSVQNIKKLAKDGKINAVLDTTKKNRPRYLYPLSSLDAALQIKYYKQRGLELPPELRKARKAVGRKEPKPLDAYTVGQREQISLWITILEEWQQHRAHQKDKEQADAEYVMQCRLRHPGLTVSRHILYRKYAAYRSNDYDGLVDKRGLWRKGTSSFPKDIQDLFLWIYLDERALNIKKCYETLGLILKQEKSPLLNKMPSYDTVYRWVKGFSAPVACLAREGNKAFDDRYGIFVDRLYDDMQSNDYWIADGHTIDVITRAEDGSERKHRMTLSAFIDARSGIYVGWVVTDNPSSNSTLFALKKAIERYGVPKYIYVDNGREYLNIDIGGTGHRRKSKVKIDLPTPILQRLGIQMTNAIPRNARAKIIEREFRNFTFLSRLMETYCGSNMVAKPEKLKQKLKNGNIPTDGELTQVINEMIDGYFNEQVYNGKVVEDRGKTKRQVYQDNLPQVIRRAAPDDLYLMMMRSTRAQKVSKNGVHLTIGGARLYYHNDALMLNHMGNSVYLRYDPEHLQTVRVYDAQERYLMTVPIIDKLMLKYGDDTEAVKIAQREERRWKNLVRDAIQEQRNVVVSRYGNLNILDVYMKEAHIKNTGRLAAEAQAENGKVIEMVTAPPSDRPIARPAACGGEEGVVIDMARMIRNNERKGR